MRTITVDKKYSDSLEGWSFAVSYFDDSHGSGGQKKERRDYRSILSDEEFIRFLKLKKIRNELFRKENIAAYMIFTDEELAEISRCPEFSEESFESLKVKRSRLEKYGRHFIEQMKADEPNGESYGEDLLPPES